MYAVNCSKSITPIIFHNSINMVLSTNHSVTSLCYNSGKTSLFNLHRQPNPAGIPADTGVQGLLHNPEEHPGEFQANPRARKNNPTARRDAAVRRLDRQPTERSSRLDDGRRSRRVVPVATTAPAERDRNDTAAAARRTTATADESQRRRSSPKRNETRQSGA